MSVSLPNESQIVFCLLGRLKHFAGPLDYRKRPRALKKVYLSPNNDSNKLEFNKLFDALTEDEHVVENKSLSVWGRQIKVPESTDKVAKFKFLDLCGKPLSAPDYLEITKNFETIFIQDVPQLGLDTKDQARRFILFIDAAYEAKVRFVFLRSSQMNKEMVRIECC